VQPIYYIASGKKQNNKTVTASAILPSPTGVTWKYSYDGNDEIKTR